MLDATGCTNNGIIVHTRDCPAKLDYTLGRPHAIFPPIFLTPTVLTDVGCKYKSRLSYTLISCCELSVKLLSDLPSANTVCQIGRESQPCFVVTVALV